MTTEPQTTAPDTPTEDRIAKLGRALDTLDGIAVLVADLRADTVARIERLREAAEQ